MINFIFSFLLCAQAGFLKIVGQPDLKLISKGSSLGLVGSLTLTNQGDEEAREVWPELKLDRFHWKGAPQNLGAGESAIWDLDENLKESDLCLQTSPECPLALPRRGQFWVRFTKNYQDRNGYLFAVPDAVVLSSEPLEDRDTLQLEVQIPKRSSKNYQAFFEIHNSQENEAVVLLQWLLPREMESGDTSSVFQISGSQKAQGHFTFRNRSGLPGSRYFVFGAVQWMERGQRRVVLRQTPFEIAKPRNPMDFFKSDGKALAWIAWFVAFGGIGMWAFWIRPLRHWRRGREP